MRPRQKCQSLGMNSLQITEHDQVKEDGLSLILVVS